MTVDKEDPEAAAAYEKRKGTKHGVMKVPFVFLNLFKKVGSKKKKGAPQQEQPVADEPDLAPQAVPMSSKYITV